MQRIYRERKKLYEPGHRHLIQTQKYLARLLQDHHIKYKMPFSTDAYSEARELLIDAMEGQLAYQGAGRFYVELQELLTQLNQHEEMQHSLNRDVEDIQRIDDEQPNEEVSSKRARTIATL